MRFRQWLKKFLTLESNGIKINTMSNIRQIIRELIKKKGPIRKVAKEMGLGHGNLIRMLRETSDPRLNTIEKILDHLGYSLTLKKKEVKKEKDAQE